MFDRYCFTLSRSSTMSMSSPWPSPPSRSFRRRGSVFCTLKMKWKVKAPQRPPRMGPTQNTQWKANLLTTKAGPRARAGLSAPL